MNRGDIITVVVQGDYGKPRPAMVIQSDLFNEHPSVTILPITSELRKAPLFRYLLHPDSDNNLNKPSQLMIDKITTIKQEKIGKKIGSLDKKTLSEINRLLALWLGIA